MIGIITAMETEMEALHIENASTEKIGHITFTKGTVAGKEVVAAVSGIGKVFAAMCAEAMILTYAPALVIHCGVAGSLSEKLGVLDLAVATGAVQYDMDTTPLGDPLGLISGPGIVELPCDETYSGILYAAATELGIHAEKGLIATADKFCASRGDKEHILSHFPAIACEMEGGSVAQVCYVNGVPFCLFRAISDSADGEAPMSYESFTVKASENAGKLMTAFLKKL